MQAALFAALEKAVIAYVTANWTKLQPVLISAGYKLARKALLAVKAKSIASDSPYKWVETIGDEAIDEILAAIPDAAPAAG